MRSRPVSVHLALILVAAMVIVLGVHSLVVIALPPPQPTLQSVRQTAEALRAMDPAAVQGFEGRWSDQIPAGMENGPLANALAGLVGVDRSLVRARWIDKGLSVSVQRVGDRVPLSDEVLLQALVMVPSLPAFSAALRDPSGRWWVVTPNRPWLTAWQRQLLASFTLSAVLLVPLAGWAASRLTRPLRELGQSAESIGISGSLEQIPLVGPREAQQLGQALRSAMQRWREQSEERVQLIAAIAHDLRTPLTGLRLRLDVLPATQRAPLLADLARMEQMVTRALEYVHSDNDPLEPEPVDLRELAEDAVQSAAAAGLPATWQGRDAPSIRIEADALALHRAIGNLLENAARYAGACEVSLHRNGAEAVLQVVDRGPGIPPDRVDVLLQPFQRGDRARSTRGGFGLGLSIAATIARRHGGALKLAPRVGGGLHAEIRLPISESPGQSIVPAAGRPA